MARPAILQNLKPGKFIWPGLFPGFAATWNWLLGAFDNLRGDWDINRVDGLITVDRTDQDRPVIRCRIDNLLNRYVRRFSSTGRFGFVESESSEYVGTLVNCYYRVGGKTYYHDDYSIPQIEADGILCLVLDATGTEPDGRIQSFADISALETAEADPNNYVIPLYTLEQGNVTLDWRIGPDAAMGEY